MVSVFELFHIGIGPSSSHTVGPMRAALCFAREALALPDGKDVQRIRVILHGSLGATGKGHGTGKGVVLGLSGKDPEHVTPEEVRHTIEGVETGHRLLLMGRLAVPFDTKADIVYRTRPLPQHPNGLVLQAFNGGDELLLERQYFSVGGGAIEKGGERNRENGPASIVPYSFGSARELLRTCRQSGLTIAQVMLENEKCRSSESDIYGRLDRIWEVMQECVRRGLVATDALPGPMSIRRRAKALHDRLARDELSASDPLHAMDWLNVYAMAVSEENAAGGQVVTAPTNGAAGIIPSVLHYYTRFIPSASRQGIHDFFLTAAAIGVLYKSNASISGAEVGCQGEVGVACSMAAAGLCAVMGGSPEQIESAAEIAMEHHLGLTCDPVGGLVQMPCIERNAIASAKAVNAARLAMRSDGDHNISLDAVIRTMWETGADMKAKYKETARGGLAVNIKRC